MKRIAFALIASILAVSCSGQWVRPNTFTEETSPTSSNFEVYSQKNGLPRRASLANLKRFFDQDIYISGDSVCITRDIGDTCVAIPSSGGAAADYDVFAVRSSGANYLLSADTVNKYNYMYLQYEAIGVPSGSTITLPSVTASMVGKVVEVNVYYSAASGLTSASIAGPLTVANGTSVTYPSTYTATSGTYRFVATIAIDQVATYRWQLITSVGSSATSAKRVAAAEASSTSIVLSTSDFDATDFYSVALNAHTANADVTLPNPSADLIGKTVFVYPFLTSTYEAEVLTSSSYLFRQTAPTTYSVTSSISIARTIILTCVSNPSTATGYYWYWSYLDPLDEIQTLTFSNDTLTISSGNSVYIPSADSVLLGSIQDIGTSKLLGRYTSGTGVVEQITIGSDFSTAGGTLALSGSSAYLPKKTTLTLASSGVFTVRYFGASAPVISGSAGLYTITVPSGSQPLSFSISGGASDLTAGGNISITTAWSDVGTSELNALWPAITIIERTTASNIQLNNQGTGYQITHPTVGTNTATTTITGVSGIGDFTIKGVY